MLWVITDDSKTGSHIILNFLGMDIMKINDFAIGPEGTSHNSPARSAGIESKLRSRPEGTVHKVSRHSCESWLVRDPDSRSHYEASFQDAGPSSPDRTRHFVPGFYESSRWDDVKSPVSRLRKFPGLGYRLCQTAPALISSETPFLYMNVFWNGQ